MIQDFYNSLVKNSGVSKHSISHVQRITRIILNHAVALGVIEQNPVTNIDTVRVPKRQLQYWTKDEVDTFLSAAQRHIHYIAFVLPICDKENF